MKNFAEKLKIEISNGLPGTEVQWALASSDRMIKGFPRVPREDSSVAAVLIPLYPVNGKIYTVFIQRTEYNGIHSGQISFPGGKKELSDIDLIHTAMREASEETGINQDDINIIDILTPLYIPVSNIVVTPVVAWMDKKPLFNPQIDEVFTIIEADIQTLLDPSIIKVKPFEIRGEMIDIKYFNYKNTVIWGATAMILHELLTIIRRGNFYLKPQG
jgi:8-oxo-dGTP pyrophosphatase MutT (NUDIX family)